MNSLTEITQMLRAVSTPSEPPLELTPGLPPTLEQCREIAKLGQQGELAGKRLTGWALNQAKAQLPHGQFLPWAQKELNLSRFSVADYRIVDRRWDEVMAAAGDEPPRSIRAFMQVLDRIDNKVAASKTPKALPAGGGAANVGRAQHLPEAKPEQKPEVAPPHPVSAASASTAPAVSAAAAPAPAATAAAPQEVQAETAAEQQGKPVHKVKTIGEARQLAGGDRVVCARCGKEDSLDDDDETTYWPYLCADCKPLHVYELFLDRLAEGTYALGDLRESVGEESLLCSRCRALVDFEGRDDDEEIEWPLICEDCQAREEQARQQEDEDAAAVNPEAVGYAHAMVLLATAALRVLDEVYAEARHALEAEGVPQLGQFLPSEDGEAQLYNYMRELERASNYAHKSRQIEGCLPALIDAMHRACGRTDEIDRAFARGVQRAHTELG